MTGPEIKTWRISRGWTQEDAARNLGYSLRGYQILEKRGKDKFEFMIKGMEIALAEQAAKGV